MATSHGSPPPGTCHTDLLVENKEHKRTYPKPDPRSFKDPRGRGGGRGLRINKRQKSSKGNSKQAMRAKLRVSGLNALAKSDHLLTTRNLTVNYDY